MVLKGIWARVLKWVKKWTLLVITFELLGIGSWNFAVWCAPGVGSFWLNFKSLLLILSELLLFCVSKNCRQICSYTVSMGTIGLCVQFELEILKFNGWCYFWQGMSQCASKMLNLQQEMRWSWKEIILYQMNKIVLVFDHFDWNFACCEAVDTYVFKLFNNFTVYGLSEQIWLYL